MYLYDFCLSGEGSVYCRFNHAIGVAARVAWRKTTRIAVD